MTKKYSADTLPGPGTLQVSMGHSSIDSCIDYCNGLTFNTGKLKILFFLNFLEDKPLTVKLFLIAPRLHGSQPVEIAGSEDIYVKKGAKQEISFRQLNFKVSVVDCISSIKFIITKRTRLQS